MDNPPPSLARGRAKFLYKEIEDNLIRGQNLLESAIEQNNSKKLFNAIRNAFERHLKELILETIVVVDKGKRASRIYIVMMPDDVQGRVTADVVQITKYPMDLNAKHLPISITRHCIERLFQRSDVEDGAQATKYLKSVLNELIDLMVYKKLNSRNGELTGNEKFELRCSQGMFFGELHEGVALVKTFVDEKKLRPDQKFDACLENNENEHQ